MTDTDFSASMAENMPLARLRDVTKSYVTKKSTFTALGGVSFDVEKGEIISIVGPSGAGKTTVLRSIAGLQSVSSGTVEVLGQKVTGPPSGVAVIFQDYSRSLLPWFSVLRNITLVLKAHGVESGEARQRAMEALESVGLKGRENLHPQQMSGGMQQRVAIARAIATRPRILLMDEPFASVDAQTRMDLEDLVIPLRNELGMTIIGVTHDVDEAVYLADRVVVLSAAPSTVAEIIPVDLGTERSQTTTKEDPRFVEIRNHVLSMVRRRADADLESQTVTTLA